MEPWLLWTIIAIAVVLVAGITTWLVLSSGDDDHDVTYLCGGETYDPDKQQCIDKKVCDNANVCGSGKNAACIDPDKQQCIDKKVCDNANVCTDKDGNTTCYDTKTSVCLDSGVCDNSAVCGTEGSMVCLDLKKYTCIDNVKCKNSAVCGATGSLVCCDSSQTCSTDNKCIECAEKLCESGKTCCGDGESCIDDVCCAECGDTGECCPDDQQCIQLVDGSSLCCDPDRVCLDASGNQICCTGKCCDGVCCDDGESCVNHSCCPDSNACNDGTCCDSGCCGDAGSTVCCGDDTVCHNGACMTACGSNWCDPVTQICDEVSTTGDKYCVDQGCVWQGLVYTPGNLRDNTGASNIPVCTTDGDKYYTCRDPSGVSADSLLRTVEDAQDASSTSQCTVNDCDYRFSEKGLVDVQWNDSTQTCTGTFDCADELPVCGDCPVSGDAASRCCLNTDGSYTGQLCPNGTICEDGVCITGYNCDGGVCKSTTSSSPQYTSYSDCIDASCVVEPAMCDTAYITKIGDSYDTPKKYLLVAVYGMTVTGMDHSGDINFNKQIATGDPWIAQWKCSKGSHHQTVTVYATDPSTGNNYSLLVNSGGSGSTCEFGNTPSLKSVTVCDSAGTDCTTAGSLTDFDVKAIKGVNGGSGSGAVIPSLIIVPSINVGKTCIDSMYSRYPRVQRWSGAGVL